MTATWFGSPGSTRRMLNEYAALLPMLSVSAWVLLHVRPPSSVRYTWLPTTNSLGFGRAASRFASWSVGFRGFAFSTIA